MTPTTIAQFIAKRDFVPSSDQLFAERLKRLERMLQIPRDEKHKSYLRREINQLKKILNNE